MLPDTALKTQKRRINNKMESILIVDDDLELCKTLSFELDLIGYNVGYVTDADSALRFLDGNKLTDLILLDLKMPGKNGYHVLGEMGRRGIEKKVIVLTAYADVEDAMKSIRMGADEFLSKPYDIDELLAAIHRVLKS